MRPAGEAGGRNTSRVLASVPWIVVLLGVGLLATLLVVALLSFRGSEPQALPPPPAPPVLLPTPSPAAAPTELPTATPSPAATPTTGPSTPSDRPTTSRMAAASPRPLVASENTGGTVTARYRVTASDRDSFEAELLVRNGTGQVRDWEVELLFNGNVKSIRVSGGSGVSVNTKGSGWYVLRSSLGAGGSEWLSLRFTRNGTGDVPGQCKVNGAHCVIG